MGTSRKRIVAVVGILILSGAVSADMRPVSPATALVGSVSVRASNSRLAGWSTAARNEDLPLPTSHLLPTSPETPYGLNGPPDTIPLVWGPTTNVGLSRLFGFTTADALDPLPLDSSPEGEGGDGPANAIESAPVLSEGQSSLDLYVYALISLGLFRSAGLVKKLSFGCIPQWYHDGGPYQIRHSFAIAPDCLCGALICFVQPQCAVKNPAPRHYGQTRICLWRESQFVPTVLAPRGPPLPW